jgi:hypothetical protein
MKTYKYHNEFYGLPLMPIWKHWVLEKLNLPRVIMGLTSSGPIYEQQWLITQRTLKACQDEIRKSSQSEITDLIINKVCFDQKNGNGCEHPACYELIDLLNKIGEKIK